MTEPDDQLNRDSYELWFIEQYDRYVADNPDAVELDKSRDAVNHAYQDAVESGALARWKADLAREGSDLFNRYVKPTRERRRQRMQKDLDWLVAALTDEDLVGNDDPRLALAFPLGDGRDKTLRYWTAEDWTTAYTARFTNSAAVVAAAAEFHQRADVVIRAMTARRARTTGDLFAA